MKHRHITPIILSCIFLMGMGGTMKKTPDFYKAQLQRIDLSDGVSEEEAVIIAQNYLVEQGYFEKGSQKEIAIEKPKVSDSPLVQECWVVSFPTTWRVRLESGLTSLTIHIDKKTGKIRSEGWRPS